VLDPILQKENDIEISVPVRPYTLTELCDLYKVCDRTLKKWLHPFREEIGYNPRTILKISQVEIIFNKLGVPYVIKEKG
jgi:hypothetical protein